MPEENYTEDQIRNTEKLLEIMDDVPEEKQPEAIRLVQALLLGATLGTSGGS